MLSLLFASSMALASPVFTHGYIAPSEDLLARWTENLFEQDTMWIFDDQREFETFLAHPSLSLKLKHALRILATDHIGGRQFQRAYSFYEVPTPPAIYILIDEHLWDQLPVEFIRSVYLNQLQKKRSDGSHLQFGKPNWFKLRWPRYWTRRLSPFATDQRAAARLADLVIHFENQYIAPVVPATWRFLESTVRREVVDSFVNDIPARRGLTIDPLPPLPPFVAKRVARYAEFSGANCFNVAVNLLREPECPERSTGYRELEDHLRDHYRALSLDESPEAGDIIVYREVWPNNRSRGLLMAYNVSIYVAPNVIFTKNGLSKFAPYALEYGSTDRERNHRSGEHSVTTYRHRIPGAYRAACERALGVSA